MSRSRVLLVEDYKPLQEAYKALLEQQFEVVSTLGDALGLLPTVAKTGAEVVVIDISLPGKSGMEAVRELVQTFPAVKIVLLTVSSAPGYVDEAFAAGASGYVLKNFAVSDLNIAVHEVLKGNKFVSPSLSYSDSNSV